MRELMERLGVARAIDAGVRVLRRCKWYREGGSYRDRWCTAWSGAGAGCRDVNRLGPPTGRACTIN